jgi:menaquinone-9 beta-reductase
MVLGPNDADVIVVGGGPAGTAAGITLARAGRDVILVDKARFPRDKACGDGLTAEALRRLEALGVSAPEAVIASWQPVTDVMVRSPSGREIAFTLPPRHHGTYAAVAQRRDLDAALIHVARSTGVTVLDGHRCTGVAEHADRVEVDIEGIGPLRASWLVAADGMWSSVRKHLGLSIPGYRGDWHAFRQYFAEVDGQARTQLVVWFEPDLLPGYAWSFPLPGGRANVGFGIPRGGKVERIQAMAGIWRELVHRPHIQRVLGTAARPEAPHRAWPIPARIDRLAVTGHRTLFVGDAAAATDPMTGEGIAQALLTGAEAGEAIARARQDGSDTDRADVVQRYQQTVRRRLLPDHRMSVLLVRALRHRKSTRAALRLAGASAWTRRHFARWLFEDYPRAILLTPRRWHQGMFTGPGAYRPRPQRPAVRRPTP